MEKSQSSTGLSSDELAKLAPTAFTTLPVRRNGNDQQARKASSQFVDSWKKASQQQSPSSHQPTVDWETLSASSPVGHLASLVQSGCRPELLVFLAKVFDYAQIHYEIVQPGKTLPAESTSAPGSNLQSQPPSEPEAADTLAAILSTNPAYKRLQLCLASEMMEVYEDNLQCALDSASIAVNAFRVNSQESCKPLTALEPMLLLEVNHRSTPAELACAEDVLAPLRVAQALALDYFSYLAVRGQEDTSAVNRSSSELSRSSTPSPSTNAVPLLMAEHGISPEDALALLRQKIVTAEKNHRDKFKTFADDKTVPDNIRRYVDMMRLATGGLHVWASCTPRYQRKRTRAQDQDLKRSLMRGIWNWKLLSCLWQYLGFGFGFAFLCLLGVLLLQRAFGPSFSGFCFYE
ncbi:hypothetical protein BJX62DRAFT_243622 [Aspergillus germanicus]